MKRPLFNRGALQEYILICCQKPTGGLIDKPGKYEKYSFSKFILDTF